MILVRTKPVYRPWLTVPLGVTVFLAFAFIAEMKAPWWVIVPSIAFGGVLSLTGCYLGSRIPPRQEKKEVVSLSGAAE
jgi:hypothetical protein